MDGYFSVPLCHFYKEPRLGTEHTDESFYGQGFTLLEKGEDFCKIKADYGYEGYVKTADLFFGPYEPTHVVISGYADLLWEPKNGLLAAYCIPRGSKIKLIEGGDERYAAVAALDGKTYYIHRFNIKPVEELTAPQTEEQFRQNVLKTAKLFEGSCYRWGGKTVTGIDCSGLAFMSYYMNGVVLHRDAHFEKSPMLKATTLDKAKTGDLLFFPGHVAIYIGDGLYIHSTTALGGVGYNSFDENSPIYNKKLRETLTQVATLF